MKHTKTFNDLEFKSHPIGTGTQAKIFFENGYGASIVGGTIGLRGDGVNTFEVAIIHGSMEKFKLVYDTPITDDVLNYQTKSEVTKILKQIEKLPFRSTN